MFQRFFFILNDEGAHPKNIDYLRNFCLGKRKGKYPGNYFGIRLLKNITMEQRARVKAQYRISFILQKKENLIIDEEILVDFSCV